MRIKYTLAWFPMVLIAILNGVLRQSWYANYMSDLRAHQISTLTAILLFGIYIWALTRIWKLESAAQALVVGLIWLGLTVAFEFLFGHFAAGHPWRRLLQDYNLFCRAALDFDPNLDRTGAVHFFSIGQMKNAFPILEYDPDPQAILTPRHVVKPIAIPEHCVLCFFNDEVEKLRQKGLLQRIKKLKTEMGAHPVYKLAVNGREVALFHPGVGAPLAAAFLEELIVLGCKKFIACGGAGVLDRQIAMGHLLAPISAVRDEGTSYHYLPPSREVEASPAAVAAIERTLKKHRLDYLLIKTWSNDGIYRETPGKIALRKSEGCLAVEMEAAALFAAAKFRGVAIGQILYAGDDVSGVKWESRGWIKHSELRSRLIWLAAEACLKIR
jgi:uridine phosphorylase